MNTLYYESCIFVTRQLESPEFENYELKVWKTEGERLGMTSQPFALAFRLND
jgi:hypothetical protein